MSDIAIEVNQLSKKYKLGQQSKESYKSFREAIINGLGKIPKQFLRQGRTSHQSQSNEFWALKDLNFQIKQGDRVGIVGHNGAGKSTLLKILSRITEPTTGDILLNGRVASLLEVGTGFHPELSGRENIFLNGAILGMSKTEIQRKFDEIVAFAEVEKFLDTPVKRYSSGMYVRLAFAVAAHLEPEILVVDEVLAVGDMAFQKKCLGKMEDVGREGRTVLFVSHNIATLERLCPSTIVLNRGNLLYQGPAEEGLKLYIEKFGSPQQEFAGATAYSESHQMGLSSPTVELVENGDYHDLHVSVTVDSQRPQQGVGVSIIITTQTGAAIATLGPRLFRELLPPFEGQSKQHFHFSQIDRYLAGGDYLISFDLLRPRVEKITKLEHVLKFNLTPRIVYPESVPFSYQDFGVVMLTPEVTIETPANTASPVLV